MRNTGRQAIMIFPTLSPFPNPGRRSSPGQDFLQKYKPAPYHYSPCERIRNTFYDQLFLSTAFASCASDAGAMTPNQ